MIIDRLARLMMAKRIQLQIVISKQHRYTPYVVLTHNDYNDAL